MELTWLVKTAHPDLVPVAYGSLACSGAPFVYSKCVSEPDGCDRLVQCECACFWPRATGAGGADRDGGHRLALLCTLGVFADGQVCGQGCSEGHASGRSPRAGRGDASFSGDDALLCACALRCRRPDRYSGRESLHAAFERACKVQVLAPDADGLLPPLNLLASDGGC